MRNLLPVLAAAALCLLLASGAPGASPAPATLRLNTTLSWPDGNGTPAVFARATGRADLVPGGAAFEIDLSRGRLALPGLGFRFTGRARGAWDGRACRIKSAVLDLEGIAAPSGNSSLKTPRGLARLNGTLTPHTGTMDLSLALEFGRAFQGSGTITGVGGNTTLRLDFRAPEARGLAALVPDGSVPALLSGPLGGSLNASLFPAGTGPEGEDWSARCALHLRGTGAAGSLRFAAMGGIGPDNATWIRLADIRAHPSPSASAGSLAPNLTLAGSANAVLEAGPGQSRFQADLRIPNLANLTLRGDPTDLLPLDVEGEARAAELVQTLVAFGLLPPSLAEWTVAGTLGLSARYATHGKGRSLRAETRLGRCGFVSPDGRYMGDKLNASMVLAGTFTPGVPPALSLSVGAGQGGALLGPALLDFSKNVLTLEARIAPEGGRGAASLHAGLKDLAQVRFDADLAPPPRRDRRERGTERPVSLARLLVDCPDLGAVFRDVFAPALPEEAGTKVAGSAALRLDLARDHAAGRRFHSVWNATGGLDVKDVRVERNGETLIRDLAVKLPIRLAFGNQSVPRAEEPPVWGAVTSGPGTLGPARLDPLNLRIALEPHGLETVGNAILRVFNGSVVLDSLRLDDPFGNRTELEFAIRLNELNLAALPGSGVPLEGRISSGPMYATAEHGDVHIYGSVHGTFFGGDLDVRDLTVARCLTPGRVVEADVEARNLNLERLSAALGVGRITGRLNIDLEDFAMAYGQPAGFRLRAQSVPDPSEDRIVSLQAVNSLSVIGTGSGLTGMGVGIFASFFKEFAYDQIAVACTLDNDRFQIKGLVKEDGVEYLIKKPLFFGVNVVNSNPDNVISFTDMLERVRRVVRPSGGKTSGGAAPASEETS